MSDTGNDTPPPSDDGGDIPSLRKAAKDGKAALSENADLKRQLMFAKAGIDTDSKLGGMLFKTWEGEGLDDLIKEAEEIGLTNQKSDTGSDPADAEQADFRNALATGLPPGAVKVPTIDPTEDALTGFHRDREKGMTAENARLVAIDKILVAGANKDPRVIYQPGGRTQ